MRCEWQVGWRWGGGGGLRGEERYSGGSTCLEKYCLISSYYVETSGEVGWSKSFAGGGSMAADLKIGLSLLIVRG